MPAHLRLVRENEPIEHILPAAEQVSEPDAPPPPDLPGSRRRDWVYREMGLLGAEATPGLEHLDD